MVGAAFADRLTVALSDEKLAELRRLLKGCSARIAPDGGSSGSGFFVDDCVLLTCAHVVKAGIGTIVSVTPFGRSERSGTVIEYLPGDAIDLALVEVDRDATAPQPAVVLDKTLHDAAKYYAVGYPVEKLLGDVGLEEIEYNGHARSLKEGQPSLLILEAGKASVTPGLSGGAVLSGVTGAVVGLAQFTNNPDIALDAGGGAIPISRAADKLQAVARYVEDPPTATSRWREILGQEGWQTLGKTWGWDRVVEITVDGSSKCWEVKAAAGEGDVHKITIRDLPDGLEDVLFRWAQRKAIRAPVDIELLGRLLGAALFPPAIATLLERGLQADRLLVRLRVVPEQLFEVPWEFVTFSGPGGEQKWIGAEQRVGLARIDDHENPDRVSLGPAKGTSVSVLGIVVQPAGWQAFMPKHSAGISSRTIDWPSPTVVMDHLTAAVSDAGFLLQPLNTPTAAQVLAQVSEGRKTEVIHYIGFGYGEGPQAQVAVSDSELEAEWPPLTDLFDWAVKSDARVLIVQFASMPSFGSNWDVPAAESFREALKGRLNAVVFTRFALHERYIKMFNAELYSALGSGSTIEEAVQRGRFAVKANSFHDDAGVFGSFALLTGPKAGTQLAPRAVKDPGRAGPRSGETAPASMGERPDTTAAVDGLDRARA